MNQYLPLRDKVWRFLLAMDRITGAQLVAALTTHSTPLMSGRFFYVTDGKLG